MKYDVQWSFSKNNTQFWISPLLKLPILCLEYIIEIGSCYKDRLSIKTTFDQSPGWSYCRTFTLPDVHSTFWVTWMFLDGGDRENQQFDDDSCNRTYLVEMYWNRCAHFGFANSGRTYLFNATWWNITIPMLIIGLYAPLIHKRIHVMHPGELGKYVNYGECWTKMIENLLCNFKYNER